MAGNLRKFVNPKFLRTIELKLMRRLLERSASTMKGFDLSVLDGDEEAARDALQTFFQGSEKTHSPKLREDLHRIAELGDARGLELILEQAKRQQVDLFPDLKTPDDKGPTKAHDPKHVALRVFLEHPTLFDTASDLMAMTTADRLEPFYGSKRGVPADLSEEKIAAFAAAAAELFTEELYGDFRRIGAYDEDDEIVLVVSHGGIVSTMEVVDGATPKVIDVRPIEHPVLRYSENSGLLRLARVRKSLQPALAEKFAKEILGKPGFFADAPSRDVYTLEPVEKAGLSFAFSNFGDLGIEKVDIVEVAADFMVPGKKDGSLRIGRTLRSRNVSGGALAGLMGTPVDFKTGWRIGELVFRATFASDRPRKPQVTVKLRPPRVLQFRRNQNEARIEALIERNLMMIEHEDLAVVEPAE